MKKITLATIIIVALFFSILSTTASYAQPYGKGIYNAVVPYGNQTSLSIATSGNITIPITPTDNGTSGSANSTVTISSTDVKGYKLYMRSINNTDMNNLGDTIPSIIGSQPIYTPVPVNHWLYYVQVIGGPPIALVGLSLTDTLIKSTTAPITNDATTMTFTANVDMRKPAGNYTADILYTAVPQTD